MKVLLSLVKTNFKSIMNVIFKEEKSVINFFIMVSMFMIYAIGIDIFITKIFDYLSIVNSEELIFTYIINVYQVRFLLL